MAERENEEETEVEAAGEPVPPRSGGLIVDFPDGNSKLTEDEEGAETEGVEAGGEAVPPPGRSMQAEFPDGNTKLTEDDAANPPPPV